MQLLRQQQNETSRCYNEKTRVNLSLMNLDLDIGYIDNCLLFLNCEVQPIWKFSLVNDKINRSLIFCNSPWNLTTMEESRARLDWRFFDTDQVYEYTHKNPD